MDKIPSKLSNSPQHGRSSSFGYVQGQILYMDQANPIESLTPGYLSDMKNAGITQINIGFTNPSSPNLALYADLITMIHQAGLKAYISLGGDKSTLLGNKAAWTVTTENAQNLASAANAAGVDGLDFDYELDYTSDLSLSGAALSAYSQNLVNYFSAVRSQFNPAGQMSLALMGWPGHYVDSAYSTGSLADTFKSFSATFGNNLNIMMYEDAHHQCLDDPTYLGGYVEDYINLAKNYAIPLTNIHIGFTNFDKVNTITDQCVYPGSSTADGCNAADTYLRVLKSFNNTPSDFGSTFWWPNEQTENSSGSSINPIPVAINEINDFNHRLVDPSWNPLPPAPSVPTSQPLAPSTLHYIVQSGDTFFTIAQQFNTTAPQLEAWNPGIDPNNLQSGEGIFVRAGNAYEVQKSDSLFSIASFFQTTVDQLQKLNPHLDPANLAIGTVIALPPGVAYEVQKGDSFYTIAQIMSLSLNALQAANPGVVSGNLQPGDVLALPTQG